MEETLQVTVISNITVIYKWMERKDGCKLKLSSLFGQGNYFYQLKEKTGCVYLQSDSCFIGGNCLALSKH